MSLDSMRKTVICHSFRHFTNVKKKGKKLTLALQRDVAKQRRNETGFEKKKWRYKMARQIELCDNNCVTNRLF